MNQLDAESREFLIAVLVAMRRNQGLTQVEVAERMGVKQATISGLENQVGDPQLSTVQRYARAVGAELIMELRLRNPGDVDRSHDRAGCDTEAG